MPSLRTNFAAISAPDGRIYVMGSFPAASPQVGTVEAYNPMTNVWCQAPLLSTNRVGLAAAISDTGRILVVGGERLNPIQLVASVDAYVP